MALPSYFPFFIAIRLSKVADYRGLRKNFFSLFSLLVPLICFALYLSFHKVELNLFLYLLLAIIHQLTMLFYNSLLKIFETKGTASGFGVALGDVGSAIALILFAPRLSPPTACWLKVWLLAFPIEGLQAHHPKQKGLW